MEVFKYESPFGQEFDFEANIKHNYTKRDGDGALRGYIISEKGNKYNASEISMPSPIRYAIMKGESIKTDLSVSSFLTQHQLNSYILFQDKESATLQIYEVIVEVRKENGSLICIIQN